MQKIIKDSGIYILEIYLNRNIFISHPKFSEYKFSKGFYYYIGSAQRNLKARIIRHLSKDKKLNWHIDWLTINNNTKIKRIFILYDTPKIYECKLAQKLHNIIVDKTQLKGFGNSDCKSCYSHIYYSKLRINQSQLLALYHSTVLFMPSSSDINCL